MKLFKILFHYGAVPFALIFLEYIFAARIHLLGSETEPAFYWYVATWVVQIVVLVGTRLFGSERFFRDHDAAVNIVHLLLATILLAQTALFLNALDHPQAYFSSPLRVFGLVILRLVNFSILVMWSRWEGFVYEPYDEDAQPPSSDNLWKGVFLALHPKFGVGKLVKYRGKSYTVEQISVANGWCKLSGIDGHIPFSLVAIAPPDEHVGQLPMYTSSVHHSRL